MQISLEKQREILSQKGNANDLDPQNMSIQTLGLNTGSEHLSNGSITPEESEIVNFNGQEDPRNILISEANTRNVPLDTAHGVSE